MIHFIDDTTIRHSSDQLKILSLFMSVTEDRDLLRLASLVEGRFLVLDIREKDVIKIYGDRFGKIDVFLQETEEGVALASDLNLLPRNPAQEGYDQLGLAHVLTYYGYRPPKRHTIYSGVERLGVGDIVSLSDGKKSISKSGWATERVPDQLEFDHNKYKESFLSFIESAGSKHGNVVYLSSGWDSTAILAALVKVFGADKVNAVTGRMLYSERSGVCNQFEIDRARKFADHYQITWKTVDLNYRDDGEEQFDNIASLSLNRHFHSFTGVNHFLLAKKTADLFGDDYPVFAGEISDGVHNLGFSQYATLFHPSYGFREYADKMASYLFGPTFLKSVLDDTFQTDPIFRFFRGLHSSEVNLDRVLKTSSEKKLQFLTSFFLRNGRFPFWSSTNIKLLTPEGAAAYTEEMSKVYFSDYSDFPVDRTYHVIIDLYNSFHWQGSTVATLQATADALGLRSYLPFWDLRLQETLAAMPEDAGRGLDLNPTKFPLKKMLLEGLNYPFEYQAGPHAYTYDVDHSFNHNNELLRFSSLTAGAKDLLSSGVHESILDPKVFDFDYIANIFKKFTFDQELASNEKEDCVSIFLLLKTGVFS